MIDLRMSLDGLEEMRKAFRQATEETKQKVRDVVERTTIMVHSTAVKKIQTGPKTGNIYTKENPTREHQASREGEAPATDTGRLVSSLQWRVDRDGGAVYSQLDYAGELEFGTPEVAARPFLFPSLEEHAPYFRRELAGVLKK